MSNEKPIVVGHLRDSEGLYGAERVILTLAKNIDRKRFTMLLYVLIVVTIEALLLLRQVNQSTSKPYQLLYMQK